MYRIKFGNKMQKMITGIITWSKAVSNPPSTGMSSSDIKQAYRVKPKNIAKTLTAVHKTDYGEK